MPLRYHKEIKLGDFIKLNINKNSMSLSAGVPGLHFNIGPSGPMINVDLPGGMSYRKYLGKSKKEKAEEKREEKQEQKARQAEAEQAAAETEMPMPSRARASAHQKTESVDNANAAEVEAAPAAPQVTPEEAPFQLGFLAYQQGNFVNAYRHFTGLIDTPYQADALFMAGITSSYLERDDEAVTYLGTLLEEGQPPFPGDAESLVTRYLRGATINIPITQFTAVDMPLELTAALLLYVELLQLDNQLEAASAMMEEVFSENPAFRLAQLSLADLYFQQGRFDDIYNLFAQHTPELKADDDVAVEVMYYWALALITREMYDAADKVYKRALARKKGISPELRLLVHYGCADLYERWGKIAQARKGFEHIFAESPEFFDVKERIAALVEAQAEN
jgi:tetratricopeptide (TPR) repeat protein